MKCGVVLTTSPDVVAGIDGLCERLDSQLEGARPDLLVAFFTPHHKGDVPELSRHLLERLGPRVLMGGPATGIIGENVEIESQAGLVLWGAAIPGADLRPLTLGIDFKEGDDEPTIQGWPESIPEGAGFLLLADPYTTPADTLLSDLAERYPGAPVVGGMASGTMGPGDVQFMTADGMVDSGCVGVVIGGNVRLDPVVSQGCRPVGRHFVITKADKNVIFSLGGKPALSQLRGVVNSVEGRDRDLLQRALHVGRVVDERKSNFGPGDLLVRNVLGIDAASEAIAISDYVRAGQTVQFMVRDADAASNELSELLARSTDGHQALGAVIFTCTGRGQRFFGKPHHDVSSVHEHVGDIPAAGIFAAGEIGPVGGEAFLHGFTASIGLLRPASD